VQLATRAHLKEKGSPFSVSQSEFAGDWVVESSGTAELAGGVEDSEAMSRCEFPTEKTSLTATELLAEVPSASGS
jgi:hypothetical protein